MHALRAHVLPRTRIPVDAAVARLAGEQYGVVAVRQLHACGLTRSAIASRVRGGRLIRVHRGVYAVGHASLSVDAERLAAVLACTVGAALFHWCAAAHRRLCTGTGGRIDIAVPRGGGDGPRGIHVHHLRLEPEDVTIYRGIPVTTVARTLCDVAATASERQVDRMVNQAFRMGVLDRTEMNRQLARALPGTALLRTVLEARHPEAHRSRSDFEEIALPLLRERGITLPRINAWIGEITHEVDLLWPAERVVVEWDSRAFHDSAAAFEQDREQTVELVARGYTVLRFTWTQLTQRPQWVAAAIAAALRAAR